VLDAIVVRSYQGFTDLAPLKQLVKGVSFKEGERYADFQKGDKLCSMSMSELITFSSETEPVAQAAGNAGLNLLTDFKAVWIGLALLGIAGMGIRVLAKKLRRLRSLRQAARPVFFEAAPAQTVTGTASATPAPAVHGSASAFRPKAQPSEAPAQAKTAVSPSSVNHRRQASQRRKMFDYNRYFADLMSTVSHYAASEPHHTNGASLDVTKVAPPAAPASNGNSHAPAAVFHANSDLIANQTTFIEEQRRLMQEQTRLIEEKSKLIAEKNQLLKLQSELIENKLL
jgi:hypothetical protein